MRFGFPSGTGSGKPSIESQVTMSVLKMIDFKGTTLRRVQTGQPFVDSSSTRPKPHSAFCKKHKVTSTMVDGYPVYAISPKKETAGKTIFYLHGGAYSVSFASGHWKLFGFLAEQGGCTVIAPDYPLPPDADWVKSWSMVEKLYDEISGEGKLADVILMGDSAGGGFALAFAQMLSSLNRPLPERLILLSPWLDITMTNPAIAAMADTDPFLSVEALRMSGERWAGGTEPADWHLSPIHGSLAKLPPISLFTGTADVLNPDAKKLRDLFAGFGIPIDYREYAYMMHVWMLFDFPESKKARAEIITLIR